MLYWGKDRQCFAADGQSDGDKQNAFSVFSLDPKQIDENRTFNQTESAGAISLRWAAKTAQKTHLNGCDICFQMYEAFWRKRVRIDVVNQVNHS
jgi:hypothetical protein